MEEITLTGIKEHNEEYNVVLGKKQDTYKEGDKEHLCFIAFNEGGHNATLINAVDLLSYFGLDMTEQEIINYVKKKEGLL